MTVLLIPGFAQTASVWDGVMERAQSECVALEVPIRESWEETVNVLAEMGGAGTYVGYSMGGRLALGLALEYPELVERLVLVSANPGIADAADRRARLAVDADWAELVASRGVDEFLDRWLAQPLFAELGARGRDHRLRDPVQVAAQLRILGQGVMSPYWDRLSDLSASVTILVGALDAKYVSVGRDMKKRLRADSVLEVVADAGHALPVERPGAVAALL